ncbi:MAG: RHS repeat-associated core domain-containing protein [Planctomycetes bacterium]|nr:RHS repeat-associated core domain-containing protein [Planctomycetota bacterium]
MDKQVFSWSGEAWQSVPSKHLRWVYFGWLPILELKVTHAANGDETGTAISRKYTWGLDLSQSVGGAGGIGGLLASLDTLDKPTSSDDRTFAYFYDGNGNVTQLVETTGGTAGANFGTLAARYEYDPYGRSLLDVTNAGVSGNYAATNTFRFSTKQTDPETGLSYFGYRYYSATMGRWISRDPIAELGGINTYAGARNSPTNAFDAFGLWGSDESMGFRADWLRERNQPPTPAEEAEARAQLDAIKSRCKCELKTALAELELFSDTANAAFIGLGYLAVGADPSEIPGLTAEVRDFQADLPLTLRQGGANAAQGVQNTLIKTANSAIYIAYQVSPTGQYLISQGIAPPQVPSPQWSPGIAYESDPWTQSASVGFGKFGADALLFAATLKIPIGAGGKAAEEAAACVKEAAGSKIVTPWGTALQEESAAALQARSQIQQGATVYKGGILGRSEAGASQFLATESPLNPGFAGRYGIPPQNSNFNFILGGRVRSGASVITRPAPGIPPNPGGGIEGVINPGDFQIEWFHMPD